MSTEVKVHMAKLWPRPHVSISPHHTCKHAHAHLAPCSGEADQLAPCYTPFSGLASKTVSHKVET